MMGLQTVIPVTAGTTVPLTKNVYGITFIKLISDDIQACAET